MDSKNNQMHVVDSLINNEVNVGKLYRAYAERFREYCSFWADLASEEVKHASWIRKLALKVADGTVIINDKRFNASAIKTFSNYLERELIKVNKDDIPLINALSTALYIEESLIEQKYFEVFDGDSIEFKKTMIDLANGTKDHRSKIKELLNKARAI